LAFHNYAALGAADTIGDAVRVRVVGPGDDVDAGFGVDTNCKFFGLAALTGHFEDLLGVCQKAAHKTLIGVVRGNYREIFGNATALKLSASMVGPY
jgi:hypothetical protein